MIKYHLWGGIILILIEKLKKKKKKFNALKWNHDIEDQGEIYEEAEYREYDEHIEGYHNFTK